MTSKEKQKHNTNQLYGLMHTDIEGIDALIELALNIRWSWNHCLLYTSPSPRDGLLSRMPSSA